MYSRYTMFNHNSFFLNDAALRYLVFYPQQSQWNIIEVNYSDEGMNSIIKLFGSPTTLLDSPDIPILRHGVDTIILSKRYQ